VTLWWFLNLLFRDERSIAATVVGTVVAFGPSRVLVAIVVFGLGRVLCAQTQGLA